MSNIAISAEDVGKLYRLGQIGTGTLSKDLNRWVSGVLGKQDPYAKIGEENDRTKKSKAEFVWALKDINFEIKQGQAVGIIGRNGAGKSTLLKLLSKVTKPTTGEIKINGRIASLLEVGTGFHPEMTGRENIFMNGAILGMTKREIRSKFDEIVDFSGVALYVDTPVKRYSSGMYVRLAFAVAAFLEPEILIIDEVLAVGDADFQKKCLGRMKDVSENDGRTVLFVSHNMSAIRTLCTHGIILENGMVKFQGPVHDAVNFYEKNTVNDSHWVGEDGDSMVKITETRIFNSQNDSVIKATSPIRIIIKMELNERFKEMVIGFTLKSVYGHPIAASLYNDFNDYTEVDEGSYEICFDIPPSTLATGEYEVEFNISIPHVKQVNSNKINLTFKVNADGTVGNKFLMENNPNFNSIVRPNWFKKIDKIR